MDDLQVTTKSSNLDTFSLLLLYKAHYPLMRILVKIHKDKRAEQEGNGSKGIQILCQANHAISSKQEQ